jgi:hypothetical protein
MISESCPPGSHVEKPTKTNNKTVKPMIGQTPQTNKTTKANDFRVLPTKQQFGKTTKTTKHKTI